MPPSRDSGPSSTCSPEMPPSRDSGPSSTSSPEMPPSRDSGPSGPSSTSSTGDATSDTDEEDVVEECVPNAMPPSDDSGPDEDGDEEQQSFFDLMKRFSNEWLQTQLNHHVSLSGAAAFWSLSMNYIPRLMELKSLENINRKIPQFLQVK